MNTDKLVAVIRTPSPARCHPEPYSAKDLASMRAARSFASTLRMTIVAALFLSGVSYGARTSPFIIGADISWIPEDEAAGATYFDKGVQKDIFTILKEHGFNYIRLRVFVDPHSERGYARRYNEAFCDLAHTQAMAKRVKAAGMGFL